MNEFRLADATRLAWYLDARNTREVAQETMRRQQQRATRLRSCVGARRVNRARSPRAPPERSAIVLLPCCLTVQSLNFCCCCASVVQCHNVGHVYNILDCVRHTRPLCISNPFQTAECIARAEGGLNLGARRGAARVPACLHSSLARAYASRTRRRVLRRARESITSRPAAAPPLLPPPPLPPAAPPPLARARACAAAPRPRRPR